MKFPNAYYLTSEEINYELMLRNYREEIDKDIQVKLRLLRRLFSRDRKEGREYRCPFNIEEEIEVVQPRTAELLGKISNIKEDDTPATVSRLTHYYLRVKRLETSDEALQKTRQDLLDSLKHGLECFAWKTSDEEENNASNREDRTKKGAIPKGSSQNGQSKSQNTQEKSQNTQGKSKKAPYEELVRKLEATIQQLRVSGTDNLQKDTEIQKGTEEDKEKEETKEQARKLSDSDSSYVENQNGKKTNGYRGDRKDRNKRISKSKQDQDYTSDEFDSEYEKPRCKDRRYQKEVYRRQNGWQETAELRRRHYQEDERRRRERRRFDENQQNQDDGYGGRRERRRFDDYQQNQDDGYGGRRERDRMNSSEERRDRRNQEGSSRRRDRSDDRYSTRSFEGHRNRSFRQARRIEHWKLSFSGDNKASSVENFLYKLKKIADREGISQRSLLRDIHLILEGQASDWFFTYVDEFEDWDDFEERIRFQFGNPNQDQGIRQRIQERKQQRGESFSAFITEIERLNKMLSRPLSRRRKFEVVWDNMRPHYRSKTSIVRIRDLEYLIKLNHSMAGD